MDGVVCPAGGKVAGSVGVGDSAGGASIIKDDVLVVLGVVAVPGMTIKGFG